MFILIGKNNDLYNVYDSDSDNTESVSKDKLIKAIKLGIPIRGVEIKDNKLKIRGNDFYINKLSMLQSGVKYAVGNKGLITLMSIKLNGNGEFFIDDFVNRIADNVNITSGDSIKVYGGNGLIYINDLFCSCKASYVDLSCLNTSGLHEVFNLFYGSEIGILNISNFDFTNINNKYIDEDNLLYSLSMFNSSKIGTLNMSNVKTKGVKDFRGFFSNAEIKNLNFTKFDTSSGVEMLGMFYNFKTTILDLRSFDTSNVTDMCFMFSGCKADVIDLSSFDTSNVYDMGSMFESCETKLLNLRSFDTRNVDSMNAMFADCVIDVLDLSSFVFNCDVEDMFEGCHIGTLIVSKKQGSLEEWLKESYYSYDIGKIKYV